MVEKLETKLEHPNLYSKTKKYSTIFTDTDDIDKVRVTEENLEYDTVLKEWVKIGLDKITYQTMEQYGWHKSIDFCVVYPNPDEQKLRIGKSKRQPTLLMQKGTVSVKPNWKHAYLLKQYQKALDFEGSTGQWQIYVRVLNGCTYKISFQSDDLVNVEMQDETEVTLAQLNELEKAGNLMIYYGKVNYSDTEGFQFENVAYRKNL